MRENINEHDKTKEMMDIIRNGFKSKLITEADEMNQQTLAPNNTSTEQTLERGDDLPEPENDEPQSIDGDTVILKAGDDDYNSELTMLKDQVDKSTKITDYKVYVVAGDVVMEGIVLEGESEGSGVTFKMTYKGSNADISSSGIPNDDKLAEVLKRLDGYYENWKDSWGDKLGVDSRYTPKVNK